MFIHCFLSEPLVLMAKLFSLNNIHVQLIWRIMAEYDKLNNILYELLYFAVDIFTWTNWLIITLA